MLLIYLIDEEYAGKPLWVAKLVATHLAGAIPKPVVSTDDPVELTNVLEKASAFYQCPVVDYRSSPSTQYLRPSVLEPSLGYGIGDIVAIDSISRKGVAYRRVFKVNGSSKGKLWLVGLAKAGDGATTKKTLWIAPSEISFTLSREQVAEWVSPPPATSKKRKKEKK